MLSSLFVFISIIVSTITLPHSTILYNRLRSTRYFQNSPQSINHLDSENLERLEKMMAMKTRRYAPFNKSVYKVKNSNNNTNTIIQEMEAITTDIDDDNETINLFKQMMDEEVERFERLEQSETHRQSRANGYMDPYGIYRYRHVDGDPELYNVASNQQRRNSKTNSDYDGGSSFEIIRNPTHSFRDIGGYDLIKKELLQTADILVNFTKYEKYNVRTPKGMIFEGPPGNGKTLMAKGFSGEINVTFIPVSGSEFSEKYVGVGASRVRELFKLAEDNKPCVIFIDEIDALARKRGNDMVSSNSEKDQTLNQLLINLDGYKDSNGIFVIGATNRLDLLDPALTRAGRMDKAIFIGNPDSSTRRAILEIHMRGKPMQKDISLDDLVEMTGGFSGAQIENLLNESMLRALREDREWIEYDDLEHIANRILAGWQSVESKFSDDVINRIAIHEMGHAIVGHFCSMDYHRHPKLVKVCLNTWSPKTPGYTVFDSADENLNIYTKDGLFSHLMVLLSGRIAEDVFYGYSVTTGARKDFEEAYNLAQQMVVQYGMGKQTIYPQTSDHSKNLIDQEVNSIIMDAQEKALTIVDSSKDLIMECVEVLKETRLLKVEQLIDIITKQNGIKK